MDNKEVEEFQEILRTHDGADEMPNLDPLSRFLKTSLNIQHSLLEACEPKSTSKLDQFCTKTVDCAGAPALQDTWENEKCD